MPKARHVWGPENCIVVVRPNGFSEDEEIRIRANIKMACAARDALLSGRWDSDSRAAASSLATKAEGSKTNPRRGEHISPWYMNIAEIIPLEEKPAKKEKPPAEEPKEKEKETLALFDGKKYEEPPFDPRFSSS